MRSDAAQRSIVASGHPGRCTATSTPASTCSVRSSATASSAAACHTTPHPVRAACRPPWHEHVSALRRLHGQLHRLRLRLRQRCATTPSLVCCMCRTESGMANVCSRPAGAITRSPRPTPAAAMPRVSAATPTAASPICHPIQPGRREHRINVSSHVRRHRLVVAVANETDHPDGSRGTEPCHCHRARHTMAVTYRGNSSMATVRNVAREKLEQN